MLFLNSMFLLVVTAFSSIDWGILFFVSIGNWVSFLGYLAVKKNELLLFNNLGYSNLRLLLFSAVFMVIMAIPLGLLLYGLKSLLWPH